MAHAEANTLVQPADKSKIKKIWTVAGILAIVTAIEFIMAFTIPHELASVRNIGYIVLTVVKAFFIIAEFMHLKHEVKTLIYSIVLPLAFIVWLLVAILIEGSAIFDILSARDLLVK